MLAEHKKDLGRLQCQGMEEGQAGRNGGRGPGHQRFCLQRSRDLRATGTGLRGKQQWKEAWLGNLRAAWDTQATKFMEPGS